MERDKLNNLIWKRVVFMSILEALEKKVIHLKLYIKELDKEIEEEEGED